MPTPQCPFVYNSISRPTCFESTDCMAWVDQTFDTPVALALKNVPSLDLDSISGINSAYTYITVTASPTVDVNRLLFNSIVERIKSFEGYDDNVSTCLDNFATYYTNSIGYCSLVESAKLGLVNALTILKGTTKSIVEESNNIQESVESESDDIQTVLETESSNIMSTLSDESDDIQTIIVSESSEIQETIIDESKEIRMRLVGLTGSEPYDDEEDYNLRSNIGILPLLKYVRHIHNDHYHSVPHLVDEGLSNAQENLTDEYVQPVRNGCVFSPIIPPPNILLQEFITNLDLDGNDKIYGKDFIIPNSDRNKPYILKTIEKMPEFVPPHPLVTMTYLEYLDSVEWQHDPSWITEE